MKDLIDDAPIDDEESDADSDVSGRNAKRKKSDDDDDELDDRLEDEDYELIEENLGVKVERVSDVKSAEHLHLIFHLSRNDSNVSSVSLTRNLTQKNVMRTLIVKFLLIGCLLTRMR